MRAIVVLFLFAGSASADEPRFVVTPKGEFLIVPATLPPCSYCDDCKCAAGKCPTQCAVVAKGDALHRTQVNNRGETIHSFDGGVVWWAEGHGPAAGYATKLAPVVTYAQPAATATATVPTIIAPQLSGYTRVCTPNGCKLVPVQR